MTGFSIWDRLSEEDKKKLKERLGVTEPVDAQAVVVQK